MSRSHIELKDVLTRDVVSIPPQATLREAVAAMVENRVSALPVVDDNRQCTGIISVTDLLGVTKDLSEELDALTDVGGIDPEALVDRLRHADLLAEGIQGWMSTDPITVGAGSTIQHAAQRMLRNGVHRLIVLDDQKRVVGVVSMTDLLAAFADQGPR